MKEEEDSSVTQGDTGRTWLKADRKAGAGPGTCQCPSEGNEKENACEAEAHMAMPGRSERLPVGH